jgi:hypothetical protein
VNTPVLIMAAGLLPTVSDVCPEDSVGADDSVGIDNFVPAAAEHPARANVRASIKANSRGL